MAALEVVVDNARGLHEGVAGGGADKTPALLAQCLAECCRFGRCGHRRERAVVDGCRPILWLRLERPEEGRQAAVRIDGAEGGAGVVDGGFDLAAMAHDACVAEESLDIGGPKARHNLEVKPAERGPEVLPLAQDRQPRQPGLEPLEAHLLVQAHVVGNRQTPLGVVIRLVVVVALAPPARQRPVSSPPQPLRHSGRLAHAPLAAATASAMASLVGVGP